MPTVSVFEDELQKALGAETTQKTFDDICFEFGLELDEVTNEYEMVLKEQGEAAAKGKSKRTIYKVDIPANRYDLLCLEGLVLALQVFKHRAQPPIYKLTSPMMKCVVKASAGQIRPFVVCAVLRNITFDEGSYQSFIDLQDKLHHNICRRRTLASIGTHDLDTVKAPFCYEALPPEKIEFVPLKETRSMNGMQLMEHLSTHAQLKAFLPIIRDSPLYPVIYDAERRVCSLPPIINGEHSKIKLTTKNVFIEVTATDFTKANITLNTVVAMFSQHCARQFEIEPVEVVYEADFPSDFQQFVKPGDVLVTPALAPRPMTADIARMKKAVGLEHLSADEVQRHILSMSIPCSVDKADANILRVEVPITRSDILHECDLIEDLAVAHGYNNLTPVVPYCGLGGRMQRVNHLADMLRNQVAAMGFTECVNWALVSSQDNFEFLRQEAKPEELWRTAAEPHTYSLQNQAVVLSNPKAREFEIVRTTLFAGILKTLGANRDSKLPLEIFEVGDVVIHEPTKEVGAKNQRRVCVVSAATVENLQRVHGALDQIMYSFNCRWKEEPKKAQKLGEKPDSRKEYWLDPSAKEPTFNNHQAYIVVDGVRIGVIGTFHPEVIIQSRLKCVVCALEMNIELFADSIA